MKVMKELRRLQQRARAQGWRIVMTPNRHLKWYPPGDAPMVTTASASGDPRALRNMVAMLRRSGLRI